MKSPTPNILILDDEETITRQLRELLVRKDFIYVFTANNVSDAKKIFFENKIDILISDIFLSNDQNGITLVTELKDKYEFNIVFLSQGTEATFEKTLPLKPDAYIAKPYTAMQVITTIRTLWNNELNRINNGKPAKLNLSKRELDILNLLAAGNTSKEIAEQLHLSVYTIQNHKARIREKLEAPNSQELISKAYKFGIIR